GGTLASLIGLFFGLVLAKGLFGLFDAVGFTLPNNGLEFRTRTVIFALVVGIGVTVLASLWPAFKATRVPPTAAVGGGAPPPPSRFARYRSLVAAILAALGFVVLAIALFVSGLGATRVFILIGVGALLVFVGVALFSAALVGPVAEAASPVARWSVFAFSALVWPFFSAPFWLLRYGLWGDGSAGKRIGAFVLGAINPL